MKGGGRGKKNEDHQFLGQGLARHLRRVKKVLAYQQWLLEHWLFGRGLDEIVRKMPCSVLLVEKKIGAD